MEFTLNLRRDCLRVLLGNLGALFKDKLRRLGQANLPETDEPLGERLALGRREPSEETDSKEDEVFELAGYVY